MIAERYNTPDRQFNLVAWVQRGKTAIYGVNGLRSSPRYKRWYPDKGVTCYTGHAEMEAISRAKAKPGDKLYVMRFLKNGSVTMALPCCHCLEHIKRAGIKTIHYTDWEGTWIKIRV